MANKNPKKLEREEFDTVMAAICELLTNDLVRHYKARVHDKLAEGSVDEAMTITETAGKMQQLADVLGKLPY